VYTKGVYALCRHPGVLWLLLFYIFYGCFLGAPYIIKAGCFYSVLNLMYVVFQDFWTFPKTLKGYEEYRQTTPFLIPTPKSILKMLSDVRGEKI
jgi:protein-S-isoprenylcysteine O-methyltransferase Ste14